ncbi:MAG TPA: choice-of-anchor D domain-containing protein [Terriglobales bacterium]|nr:choice-of-anchor D domain-containing protein [Terriglobales bacterium]
MPVLAGRGPTTIRHEVHHDVSPPLVEMIRNARPVEHGKLEAEPRRSIPLPQGLRPMEEDPARQFTTTGYSPQIGLSFEGIGDGQYGFTVEYAPPDTNGAVGATQYVQWVNTDFAVFDKTTGSLIAGPTPGNTLWTGFGGGCEANNDGDPIVLYDKLANRWVMSQFSVSSGPYLQCIAVSVTSDATGPWYRYSFQYSYFDDYPKMGVWPDAYYETFNMFNGNTFMGSDACAYNRSAMLSGQSASQICFQQQFAVGGLLPSDLDGTTLPPAGSPNYMLDFGYNSLNLYKFHVDFNTPANSTFTGPTVISVAAFTPLCNGGQDCVPQPLTDNKLDSLADRLMYRLAYRNFGTHESLVVNQSVAVAGGGGVRWYEIRNPNGTPVVAQQGTYAPDSSYRWMGSIAMDKIGDIAVGYSVSSGAVYPSIAFAGRMPSDAPGTLEAETLVWSGSGSQTPYLTRWGDYSAMTVDPTDDCTFWYTQEYLLTTGTWNWNTRIVNFKFPGCTTGSYVGFSPQSLSFGNQTVGTLSPAQQVVLSNQQPVNLLISSITVSGDYQQSNNCGTSLAPNSNCTINVRFQPTGTGVRSGTLTVTDNGTGSPRTTSLTGMGTVPVSCVPDVLSNGGFESGDVSCWTAGGVLTPVASPAQAHSGGFSAQLGSVGLPEPNGDSWIDQLVTVPTNMQHPTLSFWYWPGTDDTIEHDWQEAQVRDSSGNLLAQIFKVASNAQNWTQVAYDLTPYQGQTIQLYFNVHEDGYGDPTYMYLDDVSIYDSSLGQRFVPVTPCRVVDTRQPPGMFGGPAISGRTERDFPIPQGSCNIPATATAYAINVAVVPHGPLDYLTLWPTGSVRPYVATLNSYDGRVKANAAIVPAGTGQAISVYATDTTDVVIDINGYFTTGNSSALAFFPLTPCRVVDTRNPNGPLGGPILLNGQARSFPLLASACNIPSMAQAYSLNVAVVPRNGSALGYLTVWPTGQPQPRVSTLNAPTGTVVADAAIIPAGTGGSIETYAYGNDTDLIIDINGYFAPADSGPNPMSLYNLTPCRALDTRQPPWGVPFIGVLPVNIANSPCSPPGSATGYVTNATVVPPAPLGFLTLWPDGQSQPHVSTLNSYDGAITSNMAIVATNDGWIDAFARNLTYLILDLSAYFAP